MKKYFCNITFLFALMIAVASCSPKSENTKFSDLRKTQYKYQPRNQDRQIVSPSGFQLEQVIGLERAKSQQSPLAKDSAEIFKLAETSLELGDTQSGVVRGQYKKFGHNLLRLFYQSKENATQFDKTQTMYLPAALGFEGEKIKSLFTGIGTEANIKGTQTTFNTYHIQWPAARPTLWPVEFIRSIKSYLLGLAPSFEKNNVSKDFIKTFSAQLSKDYIHALDSAEARLKEVGPDQKLLVSANVISDVIKSLSFIPKDAVDNLAGNLVKAKEYGTLIEKNHKNGVDHVKRLIKVIANIWLDLTPDQRLKYIKPANGMLYKVLNEEFSDKMLKYLAGRYELEITDKEFVFRYIVEPQFAKKLNISCHPVVYKNLLNWVSFDQNQKQEFKAAHEDLFSVFSRYSNEEIKSDILNHYKDAEFNVPIADMLSSPIQKFVDDVEYVCLDDVRKTLDKSVNKYLLSELDIQIRNWGSMIEKVVADKTTKNLVDISKSVESQKQFTEFFEKMAYPVMENMLFGAGTISGIENSEVQLFVDAENQFSTRRSNLGTFATSAETLGLGLAAQYRRILGLPEFEKMALNSKEYYRVVFSQINKMLSMIGFRTMDHRLIPSLHRKFYGSENELDVYKYECSPKKVEAQNIKRERYEGALARSEKPNADDYVSSREDCIGFEGYADTLFAVPDRLTMVGPFTPGSGTLRSSIRGQSEIIRGAAYMLNYFSDWRGPNDFDAGMGKETFSEINIFPKSALVNLAVAAMTTPIRGLQKENSPLKLFNVLGNEMLGWAKTGLPDPDNIDPNLSEMEKAQRQIIQAAIVDLLSSGPSSIVKTKDVADFIIAVDEFLKATNGIELTKASVINPPQKTVKENMEAILKGRKLLKMVMFAMSNFMITRVQAEDGGFWDEYDLSSKQAQKTSRHLETQLSAIDALIRVYGQWGGEGAAVAAVESYYYMNQKLWNTDTNFYKSTEEGSDSEVKPYLYLKAVLNFKKIQPYLNSSNSAGQAKTLFDSYSKEFLKWNQSSKPMSTQLN